MMTSSVHYFGIRHHGPGCARSLCQALENLQPDCILIEGPPEADDLLSFMANEALKPPVALLVHSPEDTRAAVFYPFAVFSPEWQALKFGVLHQIPTRFIDLPQAIRLAIQQTRRNTILAEKNIVDEGLTESNQPENDVSSHTLDQLASTAQIDLSHEDPLDVLAHVAGFADGESWWNHLVEERGNDEDLFAAISEAMTVLREKFPSSNKNEDEQHIELCREAYMRQSIREAVKQNYQRIAVVCGAWHVPALQENHTAKADSSLLKGLPKIKVSATWIPWTYQRLTFASGYGAGIEAPGWYEFLWRLSQTNDHQRSIAWLARVANLLRQHKLDCSSAHVIEAARLADTLASLRGRSVPSLEEMNEAITTVICMGDETPLAWIRHTLMVSERLGHVPVEVPAVPLQRDLERLQKSLRLKPEALERILELDLRKEIDLARSHLLHRMVLLGIAWGEVVRDVRANRGTFRETWRLQWQPEFALDVIEASRYGTTIELAANAYIEEQCQQRTSLSALAELIDQVLLAALPRAVHQVAFRLQTLASVTSDALALIDAVAPLANIFRYGSVRQTDSTLLATILDGLITRGSIALPLVCVSLDEAAAQSIRQKILSAHDAIALRQSEVQSAYWYKALQQIVVTESANALVRGLCCRLLLDASVYQTNDVQSHISLQLSSGVAPLEAAYWLDGFLNQNALILLHDDRIWNLVDNWLSGLSDEHFLQIVPLIRRSFANFSKMERRDLGARAAASTSAILQTSNLHDDKRFFWNEARAVLPLSTLKIILGLSKS